MYLLASRRIVLCTLILASSFGNCGISAPRLSDPPKQGSSEPVYEPGGDVTPPKLTHYVEPEFSASSKEAYVEGTVKLSTVVTRDGRPSACKVMRGLSAEEDRTAIEALEKWQFDPGIKGGKPVSVHITVEIDFHLL